MATAEPGLFALHDDGDHEDQDQDARREHQQRAGPSRSGAVPARPGVGHCSWPQPRQHQRRVPAATPRPSVTNRFARLDTVGSVHTVVEPAAARRVVSEVVRWYDHHARDLPWRRPEATPWEVMVSEFMLQQTPVTAYCGPWRWLATAGRPRPRLPPRPAGEAVRAWGRLGYPRRALRLHRAAVAIVSEHDGEVPGDSTTCCALPGVGAYTAAAIASFAYGRRHVVLDTNVRRVLARGRRGAALPAPSADRAESALAEELPARGRAGRAAALGGGLDGARRAGLHRRTPAVRRLPGRGPLRVAARPATRLRPAAPRAGLRRHRPAVPRRAARRAALRRRAPVGADDAGRRLAGAEPSESVR